MVKQRSEIPALAVRQLRTHAGWPGPHVAGNHPAYAHLRPALANPGKNAFCRRGPIKIGKEFWCRRKSTFWAMPARRQGAQLLDQGHDRRVDIGLDLPGFSRARHAEVEPFRYPSYPSAHLPRLWPCRTIKDKHLARRSAPIIRFLLASPSGIVCSRQNPVPETRRLMGNEISLPHRAPASGCLNRWVPTGIGLPAGIPEALQSVSRTA